MLSRNGRLKRKWNMIGATHCFLHYYTPFILFRIKVLQKVIRPMIRSTFFVCAFFVRGRISGAKDGGGCSAECMVQPPCYSETLPFCSLKAFSFTNNACNWDLKAWCIWLQCYTFYILAYFISDCQASLSEIIANFRPLF